MVIPGPEEIARHRNGFQCDRSIITKIGFQQWRSHMRPLTGVSSQEHGLRNAVTQIIKVKLKMRHISLTNCGCPQTHTGISSPDSGPWFLNQMQVFRALQSKASVYSQSLLHPFSLFLHIKHFSEYLPCSRPDPLCFYYVLLGKIRASWNYLCVSDQMWYTALPGNRDHLPCSAPWSKDTENRTGCPAVCPRRLSPAAINNAFPFPLLPGRAVSKYE